jgi:hypothetical protein
LTNAEMFERALRLCTPQFVSGHLDDAEAVSFLSHARHLMFSCSGAELPNSRYASPKCAAVYARRSSLIEDRGHTAVTARLARIA